MRQLVPGGNIPQRQCFRDKLEKVWMFLVMQEASRRLNSPLLSPSLNGNEWLESITAIKNVHDCKSAQLIILCYCTPQQFTRVVKLFASEILHGTLSSQLSASEQRSAMFYH